MSKLSSKARKSDLKPYTVDELVNSPTMKGLVSFLEVKPGPRIVAFPDNLSAPDKLSSADTLPPPQATLPLVSPEVIAPKQDPEPPDNLTGGPHPTEIGNLSGPDSLSAPDSLGPFNTKLSSPDKLSSHDILLPMYRDLDGTPVEARYTRLRNQVQDGHTASEHLIYKALWNEAAKHDPRREFKDAVIELRKISDATGISQRNVIRVVHSLERKYSIETIALESATKQIGRKYRIFSMSSILERCRAAGFIYVYRFKNTVDLVRQTPDNLSSPDNLPSLDNLTGEAPDNKGAKPPVNLSGFLKNVEGTITQESTTGPPSDLAHQLNEWITLDDRAVCQIWEACRKGTPDCTAKEVAALARTKIQLIRSGKIDNPAGLLITSVPKFFENGGSMPLKQMRETERKRREEEARREREQREACANMLADPSAPEDEKEWARQMLDELDRRS